MFDSFAEAGLDFFVVYLYDRSPTANWGSVDVAHPHMSLVGRGWSPAFSLMLRMLASRRLKVLLIFGYRGPVRRAALAAARVRRLDIVTRSDSNVAAISRDSWLKRWARRRAFRLAFPHRTRVWTIGTANARFWEEYIGLRNTRMIPYSVPELPGSMGVSVGERLSDPSRIRVLFVGRLLELKNVGCLIESFQELSSPDHRAWSLDIVGEGPHSASLRAQAAGDPRIAFHGACPYDELDRFYHRADVLVLPSSQEAWGLVVNEALAFGVRVLVSDQVGAAQLITNDELGAVFPVGDVAALSDALRDSVHHLRRVPVPPSDPTGEMLEDLERLVLGVRRG